MHVSTYADLVRISEEELPGMGSYALDKQLRDLGIVSERLGKDDLPSIARAMSEVASMFGKKKAASIRKKILALMDGEHEMRDISLDKRIEMLTDIGYSAYFSGEWDDALENLDRARALASENGFERIVVELDAKMSRILSRKKDFDRARTYISDAEHHLKGMYDRDLKAEVLYERGAIEWWSGNEKESMQHFRKSLEISERIGNHRLMGLAHMGLANAYSETGDLENDLSHSLEALRHFERADSREDIAKMYTNIGVTYEDLGNFMEAENYYLLCVEYSRSIGYMLMEAWAFLNLSELYAKMGDAYSAETYASSALDAYREMEDPLGISLALERFAMANMEKGDNAAAEENLVESISLKEKYDTPYGLATALCTYASLLLKMEREGDAREHGSRAISLFEKAGNSAKAEDCKKLIFG